MSAATHTRRLFVGLCMLAGPALAVAAVAMLPTFARAEFVSAIAGADQRTAGALFLGALAVPFLVVGMYGLSHMLRDARPWLGFIGGGLAVLGTATLALYVGGAAAIMTTGVDGPAFTSAAMWVGHIGVLAMLVGAVVLSVGIYRSHTAPRLAPALMVLGAIAMVLAWALGQQWLLIASWALLFGGIGLIGVEVLMESDDAFEHPAEFHGFGAAAGA